MDISLFRNKNIADQKNLIYKDIQNQILLRYNYFLK